MPNIAGYRLIDCMKAYAIGLHSGVGAENVADTYPERVAEMVKRLNEYAYDMAPAQYPGDPVQDNQPAYWRENIPSR